MVQRMGDDDLRDLHVLRHLTPQEVSGPTAPEYKKGQPCKLCPTILSRYHPYDVCNLCIEKEYNRLEGRGLSYEAVNIAAGMNLKIKMRKPIEQKRKKVGRKNIAKGA